MITLYLDTNIFIRYLLQDNATQCEDIDRVFAQAVHSDIELIVIGEILSEIIYVLTKVYKQPRNEAVEYSERLITNPFITVQTDSRCYQQALQIYNTHTIDFPDALLIAYAHNSTADIFTFDKKLKKIADKYF